MGTHYNMDIWQKIDLALKEGSVSKSEIGYNILFAVDKMCDSPYEDYSTSNDLISLWEDLYDNMTGIENQLVNFSDGHYQCIFDLDYERVVCFYGLTKPNYELRDRIRQAGFIRGFSKYYNGKDRGHFLSHRQGGGMDINFFPQKKEVNRGWSPAGKVYRMIERFCSKNKDIFCFARPIYSADNRTWDPNSLEYGIVEYDQYRVLLFPN